MKRGNRGREESKSYLDKKRGQVTVFVILGIVILVVFLFALFVSSTLTKIKLQSAANEAVDSYLASEAVNYYVYTCMDSAVTSAIEDLAMQGGVFFDYQGGPYKITEADVGKTYVPFNISYTNTSGGISTKYFNVSYSIQNTSYCSLVNESPPDYPFKNTFISELYGIYNDLNRNNDCLVDFKNGYALSGFAGLNNMTRLCTLGGNNTRSISNIEFSPCYKSVIKDVNKSIESLLEKQISLRMKNCTNFDIFVDDNITILDDPVTKITYTSESLFAEATYNLSVRIKNKEPIVVKHSFSYKSDLRIALVHNYVMSVLKADSQEFFFNIYNDYKAYPLHGEIDPARFFDENYMSVKIINFTNCVNCLQKYDKLLIVEDNKSKIGNRSLTYVTVIKNRRPALEYIHETSPGEAYDLIASDNQEIKLIPKGYDPDDKNVSYVYEGWKETWDENCFLEDAPTPENPEAKRIVCNLITGISPELIKNWTQSEEFKKTKVSANYTTKTSDIGLHNVTITVSDESGLYDYQIVKILVFDLPKAELEPIKLYEDIDEGIASIEDFFILDGSSSQASTVGGGEISSFDWKIYRVGENTYEEVFSNKSSTNTIIVPVEYYEINDNNILIQRIKPLNLSNVGQHNVTLVVNSFLALYSGMVQSEPDGEMIDVKSCVPHANSGDLYSFPYSTGDPFQATHSCCSSAFEIQSATTSCYSTERYGEYNSLKGAELSNNYRFNPGLYAYSDAVTYSPNNYPAGGDSNDVYKMTFTRFCDGLRGNLCAGDMTKELTLIESCANRGAGETETCRGPSGTLSDSPSTCVDYAPGFSFESLFNTASGTSADGVCNEQPRCSTIGGNGYNAGGPMLCKATCSGGLCNNARYANNECHCSTACGAVCTTSSDFKIVKSGTSIVCQSSCATSTTCAYSLNQNMPCDGGTCLSYGIGFNAGRCYTNVACTSSGRTGNPGEYCAAGQLKEGNPNVCQYYQGGVVNQNPCGSDGSCNLAEMQKSAAACDNPICDANRGWRC